MDQNAKMTEIFYSSLIESDFWYHFFESNPRIKESRKEYGELLGSLSAILSERELALLEDVGYVRESAGIEAVFFLAFNLGVAMRDVTACLNDFSKFI